MASQAHSLKKYFSRQIVRWTLLGTLGSAALSLLLLIYVSISSCEQQVIIASESAAKAFRPLIVSDEAKDAELQIRDAFHLQPGEKVIIRDANLKRIYLGGEFNPIEDAPPTCTRLGKVCWRLGHWQMSTLVPIYFDAEHTQITAYLELILHPKVDVTLLSGLFMALCLGSLIQIHGLSTRFLRLATSIGGELSSWAEHMRQNPKAQIERAEAPLEELAPMLDALNGLNAEISKLEDSARDAAKISIIRGISHDILSPVSQLRKYVAVLAHQKEKGKPISDEILSGIERSLKRLSALAKQARFFHMGAEGAGKTELTCDLSQTTRDLLKDLPYDPDFHGKNLTIRAGLPDDPVRARIGKDLYERVLDNLVRNAAHASYENGVIDVTISLQGRSPVLSVRDTGHGIAPEIRSKIFDLNFTTRPGSGTGLGLAIVKQLCDQNDATISFKSEPGDGTEFKVQFDRTFLSLEAV